MFEVHIKINCPHCKSSKIVKNGKKSNGSQNLLCRACNKQFQPFYSYKGADPAVKRLIINLLERNNGVRDIEQLLDVSRKCILNNLCRAAKAINIKPSLKHYKSVQIDEVWSFVSRRKKGKYWLIYAYCAQTDQILAYSCGSRSAKTVQQLLKKLEGIEIEQFCTDHWKAFSKVLPAQKHLIGKAYTKNIEGVNTSIRARNRRFVRKTTCFSKKKENHLASLNITFSYRNKQKDKHHTL